MKDYSEFDPNRIKHLEMIQAVIARLGTDSFLVKGWAVTVTGAFLGFAIDGEKWELAIAAFIPAILFWGLDAYFLRAERLFRALHTAVRTEASNDPFFMAATDETFSKSVPRASWGSVLGSLTLIVFYGTLVASAITVATILCN
jgi:hypothetical protein